MQFDALKEGLADTSTPSRLFIYYNERVIEGTVESDAGAQIRDGIKTVAATGVCDETLWPYDIAKFNVKPKAAAYTAAKKQRAISYSLASQRFTIRNSWGTGWGLAGYATMPYTYLLSQSLASDLWTINSTA